MTEICIDPNELIQKNKNLLNTTAATSIIDSNGFYTYSAINVLRENFEQNAFVSSDVNVITRLVSDYGEEVFYQSLRDVNTVVLDTHLEEAYNFPSLKERIDTGVPITPIEYGNFVEAFIYTPENISNTCKHNPNLILQQLDFYYRSNFTSNAIGGFCALMPNIFGAIAGFFDLIGDLRGKIQDAIQKIHSLKNMSFKDIMKGLIDKIKKQVLKIVDQVVEKVRGIIEQFKIGNIMGSVEAFVNTNIMKRVHELKNQANALLSKFNVQNLKAKISELIDYAVNLFKNPSIEEIQFLIYRFCQLAGIVENSINGVMNPLSQFEQSYKSTHSVLSSRSAQNTAAALNAGAIRMPPEERQQQVEAARREYELSDYVKPITQEEIDALPKWPGGNGLTMACYAEEGWTELDVKCKVLLMRLKDAFGQPLILNSGYRSPEYNASLRKRTTGVAKNSYHMQGIACDVTWSGFPNRKEEFIRLARQVGWTGGIGRNYSSFVHIDIGPRREW